MDIRTVHDLQALVRGARLRQDLTQQALADRAGISRKWVSEFERGKASADVAHLLRLLAALGLRLTVEEARTGHDDAVLTEQSRVERTPTTGLDDYLDQFGVSP